MQVRAVASQDARDRRTYTLEFDGHLVFRIFEGEPEDRVLLRDLRDCARIPSLLRAAHAAGQRGDPLDVEEVGCLEDPVRDSDA